MRCEVTLHDGRPCNGRILPDDSQNAGRYGLNQYRSWYRCETCGAWYAPPAELPDPQSPDDYPECPG